MGAGWGPPSDDTRDEIAVGRGLDVAHMIVSLIRPFSFRGKARLLDRFVPRSGVLDTTLFGYSVSLDLGDHIQRLMYMNAYERELGPVLQEWIKPGMTVIDVGANAGYFTLLAARGTGRSGRVIAVEPAP